MDKEYIEREKLIRHLEDEIAGCDVPVGSRANGKSIAYGTELGLKMAKSFAETLPAADVVPRRSGTWVRHADGRCSCSVCEKDAHRNGDSWVLTEFCSRCGASMNEGCVCCDETIER